MPLISLGLTTQQERLYRYLLREPRSDVERAAADLCMPDARAVLAELEALGLADDPPAVLPPAAAVNLLVRRRMSQTRRQLAELSLAWDVLTELSEEHRGGDVFEGRWERARDLDDLDDLALSPIEQQVLHALTRHDTDEAAARSLAVSVRKFRAHVADLMARLGAATRFQAALRAKERGWL
ncbi:hypothetical protein [Planomonospora algeriensis]